MSISGPLCILSFLRQMCPRQSPSARLWAEVGNSGTGKKTLLLEPEADHSHNMTTHRSHRQRILRRPAIKIRLSGREKIELLVININVKDPSLILGLQAEFQMENFPLTISSSANQTTSPMSRTDSGDCSFGYHTGCQTGGNEVPFIICQLLGPRSRHSPAALSFPRSQVCP